MNKPLSFLPDKTLKQLLDDKTSLQANLRNHRNAASNEPVRNSIDKIDAELASRGYYSIRPQHSIIKLNPTT